MNALCVILLWAAVQAGRPEAAEPVQQPIEQVQPRTDGGDATAENGSGEVERAQEPDGDASVQREIDRLLQLQTEIRALLLAAQAYSSWAGPTESAGKKDGADAPESSPPPPTAVDAVAAGDALYLSGEYARAFALYSKAASKDADDFCWTNFQMANCLRWLGRADEAVALYQRVVTEHPDNFWAGEAEWWIEAVQWELEVRQR